MRLIWSKHYDDHFTTYAPKKWRELLCKDVKESLSNWPPSSGQYQLGICVCYRSGNTGFDNTDLDNAAKIIMDGVFCTKKPGTGPDRFVTNLTVTKCRGATNSLEVRLFALGR